MGKVVLGAAQILQHHFPVQPAGVLYQFTVVPPMLLQLMLFREMVVPVAVVAMGNGQLRLMPE